MRMLIRLGVLGLAAYGAKTLWDRYGSAAQQVAGRREEIVGQVRKVADTAKGSATGVVSHASEAARNVAGHVRHSAKDVASETRDAASSIGEDVKEAAASGMSGAGGEGSSGPASDAMGGDATLDLDAAARSGDAPTVSTPASTS